MHPSPQPSAAHAGDINAVVARMKDTFLAGLCDRIVKIETAWDAFRAAGPRAEDALFLAENEVHRIAGIGASIGMAELGSYAKALENRLTALRTTPRGARDVETVDQAMNAFLDRLEDLAVDAVA